MQLHRENSIELQNQADDYSNVQYLVSTEPAHGNSQTIKPSYLMNLGSSWHEKCPMPSGAQGRATKATGRMTISFNPLMNRILEIDDIQWPRRSGLFTSTTKARFHLTRSGHLSGLPFSHQEQSERGIERTIVSRKFLMPVRY
jgi:hypothetical protein